MQWPKVGSAVETRELDSNISRLDSNLQFIGLRIFFTMSWQDCCFKCQWMLQISSYRMLSDLRFVLQFVFLVL